MKKILAYLNLFLASMGIPLVLLVFYSGIFALVNMNPVSLVGFYSAFREKFSISIFSLNFFIVAAVLFIIILIFNKGKVPFEKKHK